MMARTKILGLIGGMSWKTTEVYYRAINQRVNSKLGGIHSAKLLVNSLDYAQVADCIKSGDFDALTRLFCRNGHQLRAAGAEALVLCANVAHKATDTLEENVGLPVLHIADFTAREVVKRGHRKIGLLATRAVMEEDFYKRRLQDRYGLEVIVPPKKFRQEVDRLIFDELSKEKVSPTIISTVHSAYQGLVRDHHVECVVLGCTEFRLIFAPENLSVPTFETTALHADGVADWSLAEGD